MYIKFHNLRQSGLTSWVLEMFLNVLELMAVFLNVLELMAVFLNVLECS